MGHLVHVLSTRTKFSASTQVDKDFVEIPALMMEQFFLQKACHINDISLNYLYRLEFKECWHDLTNDGGGMSIQPPKRISVREINALVNLTVRQIRRKVIWNYFGARTM